MFMMKNEVADSLWLTMTWQSATLLFLMNIISSFHELEGTILVLLCSYYDQWPSVNFTVKDTTQLLSQLD